MTKTSVFGTANSGPHVGINGTKRIIIGLAVAMGIMISSSNSAAAQAPIDLRSTSRFSVLAGSEITSVPTSGIKGDVGLSPAARSKITGLTPVEVTGTIFAADDGGAVAVMLTQAQGDLTTAFNDAAGRTLAPAGQIVSLAANTITIPMSGRMQYYSILSNPSVTITSIAATGSKVTISYR